MNEYLTSLKKEVLNSLVIAVRNHTAENPKTWKIMKRKQKYAIEIGCSKLEIDQAYERGCNEKSL